MNQKNQKEDPRFAQAFYDPRFHNISKKNYKTKIDNRFEKIFTEKDKFEGAQNLYEKPEQQINENSQIQEKIEEKSQSLDIQEDDYISQDENVLRNEDSSNRLALQNFDWRYMKSKEIYMIFRSFVEILYPNQDPKKYLKKVELYLSDFGQQQLDIEQREGPKKLLEEAFEQDNEGNKTFNQRLIRQYELDRLRYYYAVIIFENKFCAERIYDNYDNYEIELSGCRLDLRFLPQDLVIDKQPVEICEDLKQDDLQRLPNFITKSVGHSQVELTWENQGSRNLQHLFEDDVENINEDKLKEVMESEEEEIDQQNLEEIRAKLLGNNKSIFGDFKKHNQQEDIDIKFQVGFGEEGFNLEDDDSEEEELSEKKSQITNQQKEKLSKKQFIQKARQKKIEKRKKKLEQDKLNLLVNNTTEQEQEVDLNDPRFNKVYEDSNFAIDPTHKNYDSKQKEIQK